ncbi:hypothetical protein [Flammeovirga agarivorans]|uniref:Uncharacterized protein n=1 Tax=Flammeovirga agarivorans TaxID=2726742 RepID=A0A7X8SQB4_9BACT|nr:hypothetical protein [Flammeovirga agarivorans]NLR94454.1 hypothetical protein [Flammeovirga agarivorans]
MKEKLIISLLIFWSFSLFGQEKIDNSKPTNLYQRINAVAEFNDSGTYGTRLIFNGVPKDNILYSIELPLLYKEGVEGQKGKFGVGNIRARFFHVTHKNYAKTLGAFGYSVDVFVPGQEGIGDNNLMISPGILVGVIATEKVQFFPIISYQYRSNINTGAVQHGASFQVITPVKFNDNCFIRFTPIWQMPDFRSSSISMAFETQFNYFISPKVQLQLFHLGHEKFGNTFRIGTTIFL